MHEEKSELEEVINAREKKKNVYTQGKVFVSSKNEQAHGPLPVGYSIITYTLAFAFAFTFTKSTHFL